MTDKMQTKSTDPFKDLVFDDYERELEEALDKGPLESIKDFDAWKKKLQIAASKTLDLRKSKKITLRINQGDLIKLKAKSKLKNIPYQTLLGVVIRDFVDGKYSVKL